MPARVLAFLFALTVGLAAQESSPSAASSATASWWIVGLTAAIVLLTLGLIYVAWKQRQTYEATLAANKVVQRAYIDISHEPPGLLSRQDSPIGGLTLSVRFGVQNHGRTPADVSRTVLGFHLGNELPELPLAAGDEHPDGAAFLVPDKRFSVEGSLEVSPAQWFALRHGQARLWVLGHVEYRDQFGQRHRAGYARRYLPEQDDLSLPAEQRLNNLGCELTAGYNYDVTIDEQSPPKTRT